ncbi:pantoate--beta-alanine ligase [Coralloluteibacterium thermophilus]|uniref:Pantothenate synthetase n=1 Tax=Coralloluteibacterium thermophilum TaxID=2707049 RepID=A0ABV9NLZ8_9GAMM
MLTVRTVSDLRAAVGGWKRAGERVAFVPTMGNLHAGHFSLVALARRQADRVVASVFVNPTQFGPNEDFERYPRTPDADAVGLADAGCDLLLLPSVEQMYPFGPERCVRVRVPGLSDVLDGAHRPGHFDGVATVVLRLLNMVQPDVAVFGRKDFQQVRVIEYLVRDLSLPVSILAAETQREPDGLALSSRNQYLSAEERARAPEIHRTLQFVREAAQRRVPLAEIEAEAHRRLAAAGFEVDYVALRRADDLAPAASLDDGGVVALVAARLGRTRLIDNLLL